MDIYYLDLEGGGGTLIVTPAGESLLIDTGLPGDRDADRIAGAPKQANLKQTDYVLITLHAKTAITSAARKTSPLGSRSGTSSTTARRTPPLLQGRVKGIWLMSNSETNRKLSTSWLNPATSFRCRALTSWLCLLEVRC